MGLTWKEAEVAALDRQEWRRNVAQCVHIEAGWIKVKVKVNLWTTLCIIPGSLVVLYGFLYIYQAYASFIKPILFIARYYMEVILFMTTVYCLSRHTTEMVPDTKYTHHYRTANNTPYMIYRKVSWPMSSSDF